MTLQEQAVLSYYEEVLKITGRENIVLVKHVENQQLYMKKVLSHYEMRIYEQLKKMSVRGIPKIYELIEDKENHLLYIIEAYIPGLDLHQYVEEKGGLSLSETVERMLDICKIVSYLHEQEPPIIHRDLKPENFKIENSTDQMMLLDFDVSRYFSDGLSKDTEILGTSHYAAPEQYGFCQTDERSDIFSLGALMNTLLVQKTPDMEAYCGPGWEIIEKCTQFEPSKRYQSVGELMQDLRNLAAYAGNVMEKEESCAAVDEDTRKVPVPVSAQNLEKESKKYPYPKRLPGFRNGKLWHMLLAGIGYWFWGTVTLAMQVEGVTSVAEVWLNRLFAFGMGILLILFWFDYRGMQKKFPLMRHEKRKIRILGYILNTYFIIFLVIMCLVLIETILVLI